MSKFYVHLKHPDGSFRVIVAEKETGQLAITTIRKNGTPPRATFDSFEQAKSEAEMFLIQRKNWLHQFQFPDYEILVFEEAP